MCLSLCAPSISLCVAPQLFILVALPLSCCFVLCCVMIPLRSRTWVGAGATGYWVLRYSQHDPPVAMCSLCETPKRGSASVFTGTCYFPERSRVFVAGTIALITLPSGLLSYDRKGGGRTLRGLSYRGNARSASRRNKLWSRLLRLQQQQREMVIVLIDED